MKCTSYCTAEAYNLSRLVDCLTGENLSPHLFDRVVHVLWQDAEWTHQLFFFDYGCYVIWAEGAMRPEQIERIERWLAHASVRPLSSGVEDVVFYTYGSKTSIVEEEDTLFIENDPLIKLSMSHGLSQSVKLAAFERAILDTIQSSRHLTDEFAKRGRTSLSHHGLAQMIGHLFAARQSIHLHTDILDTPEFFWRRPKYEPYYHMVASFMDLSQRIHVLNQRLSVIQELYQMLSDELRHEHSSRLEWTVIVLIMFEVVLGLLGYFY